MILLDTNALLWLAMDSPRLGELARRRISSERTFYSSVSITEISIKHMFGRLPLPGGDTFPSVFDHNGLVELPLTARHSATLLDEPTLLRHDPFDRMILAQARAERCHLFTSDPVLLGLGHPWIDDCSA
ncbi:type II toxin-antitoxin system VapC family toxin [Brevibacterium litoralis]|uniref:type II toxin-antitoxin system VapC family toxin n=1 Tax=Brevibacterium litoralis TaxID=3138935 RepID=UPI0032EFE005